MKWQKTIIYFLPPQKYTYFLHASIIVMVFVKKKERRYRKFTFKLLDIFYVFNSKVCFFLICQLLFSTRGKFRKSHTQKYSTVFPFVEYTAHHDQYCHKLKYKETDKQIPIGNVLFCLYCLYYAGEYFLLLIETPTSFEQEGGGVFIVADL